MEFDAGRYDIAVIGAGHAGIEAGLACARMGLETVVFTINLDAVGNMPCNPAIGGTGKGHLVRELDALGGEMAKAADRIEAVRIGIFGEEGLSCKGLRYIQRCEC